MSHALALCSRVLYDKQVLADRTELESLKGQLQKMKVKHKYLQLKERVRCCFSSILESMWNSGPVRFDKYETGTPTQPGGTVHRGENAFALLCDLCGVEYAYLESGEPVNMVNRRPYHYCCDASVHLVLHPDNNNNLLIFFGKPFWEARTVAEQTKVYLFFYVLTQIERYSTYWYSETVFQWCLSTFLLPYTEKNRRIPIVGVESFEEFYMESEEFPLN